MGFFTRRVQEHDSAALQKRSKFHQDKIKIQNQPLQNYIVQNYIVLDVIYLIKIFMYHNAFVNRIASMVIPYSYKTHNTLMTD